MNSNKRCFCCLGMVYHLCIAVDVKLLYINIVHHNIRTKASHTSHRVVFSDTINIVQTIAQFSQVMKTPHHIPYFDEKSILHSIHTTCNLKDWDIFILIQQENSIQLLLSWDIRASCKLR